MSVYLTAANDWVISSHGCWLPGTYATVKAARFAFQFPDAELGVIHKRNGYRPITTEDLKTARAVKAFQQRAEAER